MRLWESETPVTEIDGFSAKVMACIGGRELIEPDRARLLHSTRAAEGTECDGNRLRAPEGVDMA
jgi:hypothetical protein